MGISLKLHSSNSSSNIYKIINMNTFACVVLSLCSVATTTAAPGNAWTVWNQHSYRSHHQAAAQPSYQKEAADIRAAPTPAPLKSIAATAAETPALSTLLAAVKAAGLAETLSGEGDFTVFAPTNDAFAKLPADTIPTLLKPENKDVLAGILLRHVLPNRIEAAQIPAGSTNVKTVGGEEITVTAGEAGVSITSSAGTANVIATDIQTSNGVVHLVDTVF